jgi:hypothetical protein
MLQTKEHTPIPNPSVVFIVEFIKELGGVSHNETTKEK